VVVADGDLRTGGVTSSRPVADLLITGGLQVVTCAPVPGDPLGRVSEGVVAVVGDRIAAVGTRAEVEASCDVRVARVLDAAGGLVAPGFVDCHTHVVFGGSRAAEYAATTSGRLEEFRHAHGLTGILATVAMTRSASPQELFDTAADRLRRMFAHGTTTVESKSGYGLTTAHELRMLEVNRRLDRALPIDVFSTFLGAHAVPDGVDADWYTELVVREMIPAVRERGLAEFCDVYCDDGYFDIAQSRRILEAGLAAGLTPKIHADAYSATRGAELAVELGAVSIDHLNHTTKAAMHALAQGEVVGVVMPALDYAVSHPRPFDGRAMVEAGMTLALATDLCPGCWVESQQLVMAIAARSYGITSDAAFLAATAGGAQALGLTHDRGSLAPGKLADIQILDAGSIDDLVYRIGVNSVRSVIKRGVVHPNACGAPA
jgi:imidazolonepropionase